MHHQETLRQELERTLTGLKIHVMHPLKIGKVLTGIDLKELLVLSQLQNLLQVNIIVEQYLEVGLIPLYHPKFGQVRISRFVLQGKVIVISQLLPRPQTVDHTWFTTLITHLIVIQDIVVLTNFGNECYFLEWTWTNNNYII